MKLLKKLALVAALSSVASYASALTPIADSELSKVSGQDGVSIAADLKIDVGSFVYTDTDTDGGSVSFNGIKIRGAIAATLDIMSNASFKTEVSALNPNAVIGVAGGVGLANFMPAGDVVKIAIPEVEVTHKLSMSVDSIKMGNSAASYGSMAMNDVRLQGTTVYIWAH